MLRRIVLSKLLIVAVFMVGCSDVVSTPNTYTLVSDRSIDGLQSGGYVHLIDTGNDKIFVRLQEGFEQAWQSTARAAELADIQINEANAQRGFYSLQTKSKANEDKGFVIRTSGVLKHLESLGASEEGDVGSVRIRLITLEDNSTKIVPVNAAGNWDTRKIAVSMLEQLHDAFSKGNKSAKKTVDSTNTQHSNTAIAASSSSDPVSTNLLESTSNTASISGPTTPRVELIDMGNNKVYIHLHENFEQAWFTAARGLKRAGINISKADSLHGVYSLGRGEAEDEGMKIRFFGVFKRSESSDSNEDKSLRLRLKDLGDSSTKIVPVDDNGEWDTSDKAIATVNQLYRSLNQL